MIEKQFKRQLKHEAQSIILAEAQLSKEPDLGIWIPAKFPCIGPNSAWFALRIHLTTRSIVGHSHDCPLVYEACWRLRSHSHGVYKVILTSTQEHSSGSLKIAWNHLSYFPSPFQETQRLVRNGISHHLTWELKNSQAGFQPENRSSSKSAILVWRPQSRGLCYRTSRRHVHAKLPLKNHSTVLQTAWQSTLSWVTLTTWNRSATVTCWNSLLIYNCSK